MSAVSQHKFDGKRRCTLDEVAVVRSRGEEDTLWKVMENAARNVGVFSCERLEAKKFREDAEKEKQEGIQGQWQRESPAIEYLEQVKCCKDTDCTPRMMKQTFFALKGGDWEECHKNIFQVQAKSHGMGL